MECKVIVCLCFFFATVNASTVDLTSEWKPNLGWVITCSWNLFTNDSLQSVRLCNNDRQFMIYRPETDGKKRSEVFQRPEDLMLVECTESIPRGLIGTCVLTMELHQPQIKDFTYSCEVSGERPMFRIEKKSLLINAFVPPTDAVLEAESKSPESRRVTLNCTSSGLPVPHLTWTIGEQKVPADFTGSFWNATSKLWQMWSMLSYTTSDDHTAVCTPEVNKDGEITKGRPAAYSSADGVKGIKIMVCEILICLMLLR